MHKICTQNAHKMHTICTQYAHMHKKCKHKICWTTSWTQGWTKHTIIPEQTEKSYSGKVLHGGNVYCWSFLHLLGVSEAHPWVAHVKLGVKLEHCNNESNWRTWRFRLGVKLENCNYDIQNLIQIIMSKAQSWIVEPKENIKKKFNNVLMSIIIHHLANEDISPDPPRAHRQVKTHEARDALGVFGAD